MKTRVRTLATLLASSAAMAFGQATNSADVTGTVTDLSGAVIPGVTVTVKDIDKNSNRIIQTNASGLYDTGPLVPEDQYTIVFARDGFAGLQRGPMILHVGLIGMNVQLSVGQTTQQVTVNESAPLLETTTAELSSTLPSDTLQTLPQTGTPDWQSFLVLMPGVSGVAQNGNSASNPGMGGVSANGSMPFSTAMLDGANVSSPMSNNVINTPIFDIIGEVKTSDSSFSAQYGTGGIIYNQISKGGTNTIHGLVYDYIRNTDLNAASYGFGAGRIPPVNYNDYGFQVSGPIIKNRVFALFDYDHTINHSSSAVTFISVPTAAMLNGDFTGLPTLYDPTTQVVDPVTGFATRQSFASEYGNGNKIPQVMLDKVAQNIQKIYQPLTPKTTGIVNNYNYLAPSQPRLTKWFGRFDADVSQNNRVTGSAAYNYTITPGFGPVAPVNVTNNDVENMSGQLSDVHTFGAHTINEARAGWMGEYDLIDPATRGTGWPTKLGLQFAKEDIFPNITINGFYSLGSGVHANYKENVFDLSDVLTLIRGRHVLHFGGELIAFRADSTAWGNIVSAGLGFTGVYTALSSDPTVLKNNPGTGLSYADFLLGYAQNWSALYSPEYGGRLKDPAAFFQDDFKITPKLTLNLGLRWDGRTGWSDSTKNERSFDPTITNPATNAPGAMWYAVTHTNGRTQLQSNKLFALWPRVGAAYQLGAKMTVRSGFGMYTFPWNVDNYASCCLGNSRSSSGNETDSTGNISPVVILSSDGNTNYQGGKGASINSLFVAAPTTPQAYNGQAVSYMKYDQPLPRLYSWNLTVQRQLTGSMMAEAAYVGSSSNNLIFNTDLNQVPASLLAPNDAGSRPFPEYQAISGFNTNGQSFYSGFQAQIERRFSNGFMFNFNYTWSHMTDNQDSSGWGSKEGTTVWQNAYVPSANHGAANFDVRQMFKAYGIYDLPFGTGRRFLNNNKVLDEGIGGWTLSATWLGQGGNPFTPYMLTNNSYASTGASGFQWFPDQVAKNPKSGAGTIAHWFNSSAFASPTPGTLGNMRRNSIYGPGVYVMNASIRKTFPIWERVSFDFSANATNVLNHPSFGQPDLNIGGTHSAAITTVTQGGRNLELIGKLRF
jgi:hypothetical protein